MPGIQPGISYMRILMYFSVMRLSMHFCRWAAGTTVLQSACASFIR